MLNKNLTVNKIMNSIFSNLMHFYLIWKTFFFFLILWVNLGRDKLDVQSLDRFLVIERFLAILRMRFVKLLTNFKDWSSEAYDNTREKILRMKNRCIWYRDEIFLKSTVRIFLF